MIWTRMLAYITGTVDQELLLRNEYLAAENRVLRAQVTELKGITPRKGVPARHSVRTAFRGLHFTLTRVVRVSIFPFVHLLEDRARRVSLCVSVGILPDVIKDVFFLNFDSLPAVQVGHFGRIIFKELSISESRCGQEV